MKPRRPRMTRQFVHRLLGYVYLSVSCDEECGWEPGEEAQWNRDMEWLYRMRDWFDRKDG